jgi:hypothetical protein
MILILLVGASSALAQVRINEVGTLGVEFQSASKWVELYNEGDAAVDVSSYWLCNFPNYKQISTLNVLDGNTTIPAGDFLVLEFADLGDTDSELGLYSTNDFANSDAMLDYMQYGSAGHMRESVAVSAGVWDAGTFVMPAPTGESMAYVGGGANSAQDWMAAEATAGSRNPMDPDTAPEALVDRFAEGTGTLFVRNESNGFPGPGEPIDFDQAPFITRGLGELGQSVRYYNFDVMPRETAPIFALFREGESTPVEGQLNIVDVKPGDDGYNDFWHVHKVTVPSDYVANTITNLDDLMASGYAIERTNIVVNCPVVPDGSTADLRYTEENDNGLVRGWYRDQVIYYFDFSEKMITVDLPAEGSPDMPLSPIYVSFNLNPGEDGGGPPSGFKTEDGSDQTHNVVDSVPTDDDYSPLWVVNIYDNAEFDDVHDIASATSATLLAAGAAMVNCPIVSESGRDPSTAPRALVDRFAEGTGTLFVRDGSNGFPEAGQPVDFDQAPFITRGLAPDGESVQYYNFDVMPRETAPIFALFREGESMPVEGQRNIVDVKPGDEGYNDFWHVHKVTVPSDYEANSITSLDALMASGYPIERTNLIVNCPVVPDGSTADLRLAPENDAGLVEGWYRGKIIYYFDFSEKMITVDLPAEGSPDMPVSPIYVSFNINPGEEGGGPPSGFMTEENSDQTHNVVASLPADDDYSPLWVVNIYDNAEFAQVQDLASAESATILAAGAAIVNCPIVTIGKDTAVEPVDGDVPSSFALEGNYPNPFNPQTTIRYSLDQAGSVNLVVYDMLGRTVATLVDAPQSSGVYRVTWDGRDASGSRVATGTYLYRLTLDGRQSEARTMTLLK